MKRTHPLNMSSRILSWMSARWRTTTSVTCSKLGHFLTLCCGGISCILRYRTVHLSPPSRWRRLTLLQVYNFRNKEEHLIVLYCEDEKISRDAAKVMVDRGIDNIYLLTGGMVAFAGNEAYIEGNLPEHMIPPASAPSRSSRLGSIAEDKAYSPRSPARPSIRSPESKLTANKLQRHNLTNPSSSTASRSSERMETATARSTMSGKQPIPATVIRS